MGSQEWSARLRQYREKLGLTQLDAAGQVGVTAAAWSFWESRSRKPSRDLLIAVESWSRGAVPASLIPPPTRQTMKSPIRRPTKRTRSKTAARGGVAKSSRAGR